jgi:hypothetical protein
MTQQWLLTPGVAGVQLLAAVGVPIPDSFGVRPELFRRRLPHVSADHHRLNQEAILAL